MLKIKLARFGKKGQPHYRIVINEGKDKRDGSYVELLGTYAPTQTPKSLELNVEKYDSWIKKGAQPTETVAALYTRFKSGNPFPVKAPQLSRKQVAKQVAAAESAKAQAEEAKAAPAPVEESPAAPTE